MKIVDLTARYLGAKTRIDQVEAQMRQSEIWWIVSMVLSSIFAGFLLGLMWGFFYSSIGACVRSIQLSTQAKKTLRSVVEELKK